MDNEPKKSVEIQYNLSTFSPADPRIPRVMVPEVLGPRARLGARCLAASLALTVSMSSSRGIPVRIAACD